MYLIWYIRSIGFSARIIGVAKKRTLNISEEERERRRQNALELTQQGKIGPQYGKLGGRPRKPRATEIVAEKAKQHAEEIANVFLDIIQNQDEKSAAKLAAANSWLEHEQKEAQLQLQEEKHDLDLENASQAELMEFLVDALTQGNLAEQFGPVFDIPPGDIEEISESGAGEAAPDGDSS